MFEKVGVVTTIYPERCTARVRFDDQDDLISDELQIVVRGTLKNKDYWMPKVGEHVFCTFTKQKKGYILGAVYSEESSPLIKDEYKRYIKFEDGTTIEYDTKTHTLSIDCVGFINIKGNIRVDGIITSSSNGGE